MTLIVQQSTFAPDGMSDEYHFKIVGARNRMRTEQYSRQKINAFLTDLFDNDLDGLELEEAPLEYSGHAFNEDMSNSSHHVVLVKLRLTKHATEASMTLDEAAARLCQVMFHPEVNGILGTLTTNGLLGISAVSEPFKQYWTQTIFRDCLVHGPRLLKRIDRAFCGNSLPEWALALSFAVVAGLNFEVFASAVPRSFDPIMVFGADDTAFGSSILRKYMQNNSYGIAEQEKTWTRCHTELLSSLQTISERLKEATGPVTIGTNTLRQHKELCNALYDTTLIAAKTFTLKQDIFDGFAKLRNKAASEATELAAAVTLTNCTEVALAHSAALTLTHFGSALTFVTTSQALPLASWGLADVAVFLTGGGAPLVYTTTLSVAWPVVITVLGFSAFFGMKKYHNQEFKKHMAYHMRIIAVIGRAWGLAHDTHKLLQWIRLMDASVPGPMRFVDDNAEAQWAQFIRRIRAAAGGNAATADLGPRTVSAYLFEQSQSWCRLREALTEDR